MSTDNLQQAIAKAVAEVRALHSELGKSHIDRAYRIYQDHFAKREDEPPVSERPAEDALLLAIWDVIVDRETARADQPGEELEDFYVRAFDGLLRKPSPTPVREQPVAVTPEPPAATPDPPPPVEATPVYGEQHNVIQDEATEPVDTIFRLLVSLDGSDPAITRTLLVSKHTAQPRLHHILQATMGWRGTEQFQFYPPSELDLSSSADTELGEMFSKVGDHCGYEFDHWYHDIELLATERPEGRRHYPVCIAGQRACPPEDAGGVAQYNASVAVLQQPEHPDYEEMAGWLTQDFHPAAFNIEQANLRLGRYQSDEFEAVV